MEAKMNNLNYWVQECIPLRLDTYYTAALEAAGFTILDKVEHFFNPQGWTVLYLLAESHLAIHTFPEQGKAYVELSSCVDKPFTEFIKHIATDIREKTLFFPCVAL